ncbi:NAD(P)H-quinone oxidoreductase [Polycladidibacter stylochi]|uniref:NAD(P)H-quinone oxidoreductase n=1 Tax=Polycladidibacter stylochi TaxID=1807766 RepID=UPI00082F950F|nr:NAD(P)H-quinone oxidoreductase [Pseudovibrio stylochi]
MKAVVFDGFGGPEVLAMQEVPRPEPKEGEVLIEVMAAGVNRPDVLQRQGVYPAPSGASPHPGLEVSGVVVSVGSETDTHWLGQQVCALVSGGGYAQYVTAPSGHVLPVPEGVNLVDAAGIAETFFTVWSNVFEQVELKEGESFLVHGGSSGIGTTAIQLAKAFGAHVYTTVGSDEKAAAVTALGADFTVNYKKCDFAKEILGISQGRGVDVILDMIGGDYIDKNYKVAALGGRIAQIAALKGLGENVNIARLMVKRLVHTGSTLRPRSDEYKAQIARELRHKVWPLFAEGKIRVVVDHVFSLENVVDAHRHMEAGNHIGKILLKMP